jgi:predicted TIM-barrel fold metal-dependent hydrolase
MMDRRSFLAGGAALAVGCSTSPRPAADGRPYEIWDQHCHLGPRLGASPVEQIDALLRIADGMGITRLVLMAVGPHEATPAEMRRTNDDYLRALERGHPRTLGYVFLNPAHLEVSLQEIERCVRDGPMVGFKLHVAKRCDAPEHDAILKRAAELGAPVYQHTWLNNVGNLPGESTPADAAALASRHPGASLVCGHAGGKWELGVRAVRAVKHLSLEVAGFDPQAGAVEMAVRELGAERVIYGSDVPGRSFASQLAKVLGAEISDEAKRLVVGGNLKRLLTPILQAKGIPR